jgi:hypothetical protein
MVEIAPPAALAFVILQLLLVAFNFIKFSSTFPWQFLLPLAANCPTKLSVSTEIFQIIKFSFKGIHWMPMVDYLLYKNITFANFTVSQCVRIPSLE